VSDNNESLDVRWNPDGQALASDGETVEVGRWEFVADDEVVLWWSESDRQAFRLEQDRGGAWAPSEDEGLA
jgi:hypothetical protein